ncbi:MAG: tetratricopeptide repeat protein [Chlorobi bacterium]|nr:tetratricopeptide repeat protein [Chlorobiota bacterium]
MPQSNELRVFISSTFRDLQEEREYLVKKVFPEIRAMCRQRGVTFTEIDLRWGITEEEAERDGIIRICLEEIDRCRPFFIGILGERYGWMPPASAIAHLISDFPDLTDAVTDGASITEMEIQHGATRRVVSPESDASFYFRHQSATPAIFAETDPVLQAKLQRLKEDIRASGYPVREGFTTPQELGAEIHKDLRDLIEKRFPLEAAPSLLEQERTAHNAFAQSRRQAYIRNESTVKLLSDVVESGQQKIVITAQSGMGKSALIAYWSLLHQASHPGQAMVTHYVGASASARDHIGLMLHIIREIKQLYSVAQDVPDTARNIEQQFPAWLAYVRNRKLLLIIDAVNQLPEPGQSLHWLPNFIPPDIQVVLTTTEGPLLATLCQCGYAEVQVQPLSHTQRAAVIERYLAEYHKKLGSEKLSRIADDQKCSNALFLRTVLEELRVFGVHEELDTRIEHYMDAVDLDDLFQRVLERMEHDHGVDVVQLTMEAIWASRAGLTETEMLELMSMEFQQGTAIRNVTRLELSTFLVGLDYHLKRNQGLLDFFHQYLRSAVQKRYLDDTPKKHRVFERLARYFQGEPVSLRATLELLHALDLLGARARLHLVLSDIERFQELWVAEKQEVLRLWSEQERATVTAAYSAGLQQWQQWAQPQQKAQALDAVAQLFVQIGAWQEAEQLQLERIELLRVLGDRIHEVQALAYLAGIARRLGRMEDAERMAAEAEAAARKTGDNPSIVMAVGQHGTILAKRGEYDAALACFAETEAIARLLDDRRSLALSLGNRGYIHLDRGEYDKALDCCLEREAIAREQGDHLTIADVAGERGIIYTYCGKHDDAVECYRTQERIVRQFGFRAGIAACVGNRGLLHLDRGEYADAAACFFEHEQIAQELGDRLSFADALCNRGSVHLAEGELDKALSCFSSASSESRSIQHRLGLVMAIEGIVQVFLELLDSASRTTSADAKIPEFLESYLPGATPETWRALVLLGGRTYADEGLSISHQLSKPDSIFRIQILLARINAAQGNRDTAVQSLSTMLHEAGDDEQRAELHYWLWKITGTNDGVRIEALRQYEQLIEKSPKHAYRQRIKELNAAATTAR